MYIRRRFEKEWLKVGSEALEFVFRFEKSFDVVGRNASQLRAHSCLIGPPTDHVVFQCGLYDGIALDHFQAIGRELEIPDYGWSQHGCDVRGRRYAAARRQLCVNFLGYSAATADTAALQHEHFSAGFREVSGSRKAVVSGPDNNDVITRGGLLQVGSARG